MARSSAHTHNKQTRTDKEGNGHGQVHTHTQTVKALLSTLVEGNTSSSGGTPLHVLGRKQISPGRKHLFQLTHTHTDWRHTSSLQHTHTGHNGVKDKEHNRRSNRQRNSNREGGASTTAYHALSLSLSTQLDQKDWIGRCGYFRSVVLDTWSILGGFYLRTIASNVARHSTDVKKIDRPSFVLLNARSDLFPVPPLAPNERVAFSSLCTIGFRLFETSSLMSFSTSSLLLAGEAGRIWLTGMDRPVIREAWLWVCKRRNRSVVIKHISCRCWKGLYYKYTHERNLHCTLIHQRHKPYTSTWRPVERERTH